MFSILILTYNEEQILGDCLSALSWCDDVVVYDSYSSDRTRSISIEAGARFIQRPDQNLSTAFGGDESFHRTWGLRNISFAHPWLLVLDADERISLDALAEISQTLGNNTSLSAFPSSNQVVAYQFRRRDFYQGQHLKHVQATQWYIRLFRPEFVHYQRLVNPVTVVHGEVSSMMGCIDHYPFSKGLTHWIARHNTYSTLEAKQFLSTSRVQFSSVLIGSLFSQYFHQRRFYQKQLFNLLPARPLLKFAWLYIYKCGFLDRGPGFTYALLQSIYEYFIVLKVRELTY